MNRPIRWYDYITINIYFMGLTVISQTMTPLVVPLLVQQFVGVGQQATFYGTARLWSLMVALLVQALMGMLSDRSTLHWGRRRPFIFIGTMGNLVFISLIGFSAGLEGWTGYWFLFTMLILLSVTSNTAQGAVQALIPDLVPEDQRGRFSGVKALFEVPLPVIFVSFVIGRLIGAGHMWAGLIAAMGLLTLTMLISMLISEKPLQETPTPLDWQPFLRLVLMTALFTLIILGVREILILIGHLLEETSSTSLLFAIMGVVGLAAMVLAVGLGVYFSVYLSVGNAGRQNSSYTWWVINRLAYLVGSTNLASFAVFFLQGRLGLIREKAAGPASQLILIVGIFILLTAVPSGWLADRFGRKLLVAISGLTAALGTLVIILAPNLAVIYIGGILVGTATGLFFTANWALGTSLVPKVEAGRYLGISNLAGAGAGAVGAYIGGPIADYFTRRMPATPEVGYVLLFAIYGMMFLLSVAALARVREKGE